MTLHDKYERFVLYEYSDGRIELNEGSNFIEFQSREELNRVMEFLNKAIPSTRSRTETRSIICPRCDWSTQIEVPR